MNNLVLLIASSYLLTACAASEPLNPLNNVYASASIQSQVNVNFCTDPAYQQKQYLKTIVVLDHSGSNKENYKMNSDGSGGPDLTTGNLVISSSLATDPSGHTRYGTVATPGTLLNYLSTLTPNLATDPTRFFALVDFNVGTTTFPVNSQGFTSDIPGFYNYVLKDSGQSGLTANTSPNDQGATSYLSALQAAYTIINADIQDAKNCAAQLPTAAPSGNCYHPGSQIASSYVVIFMSDGSPILEIDGFGKDAAGNIVKTGPFAMKSESSTSILGQTAAIAALASDEAYVTSVNLFTIYYYFPGNVDNNGQSLLAEMAKIGNGVAYNALSGSNIDYSRFQIPQKLIKYTLQDVFVTNDSVAWWTDGKLHPDTDMDGLPDDVESAWGSDPLQVSTDRNGVSDLVKYRATNAKVCNSKNAQGLCQDAVVNYAQGVCNGVATVAGQFVASDPDGLNDCEKFVLNDAGGVNNPDSNGDMIPDWLELKNGVPFQIGTSPAVNTPDQDGYTVYQKIKYSLPVSTPIRQLLNVTPANYNMRLVSQTALQDCYQLNVTSLPMLGVSNRVRVDVILKSELLRTNYLYRVGHKTFGAGMTSLNFNDWNDAAEITAKTWSKWP